MKRRIFAIILIATIMVGMASCMKQTCPAYASTNVKVQNNKG